MERNSSRIVSVCLLTMASGCRAYKDIAYALWRTLEAAPTSDVPKCGNYVESESAVESGVQRMVLIVRWSPTDGVESPLSSVANSSGLSVLESRTPVANK